MVETIQTATDETLYFFTNRGNCFMLDVTRIPETMKLKDRGSLLTGLIAGLADHEHAVALVCVKSDEMAKKGDFLFITKNGQVKRTAAAEYGIRRARFAAINLKGNDELVGMVQVDPEDKDDIILITQLGMALRFKLDTVSCTGARRRVSEASTWARTTRCAGLKSRRRAICCLYSAIAVSASGCSATTWNVRARRGQRAKAFADE